MYRLAMKLFHHIILAISARCLLRYALLLAALLCLGGLTSVATAQTNKKIEKLRKQSTELKKQISESEKQLKTTKKDVNAQLGNLAVINSRITEQQKLVDDYQIEVNNLSTDISHLSTQLDSLTADLNACKRKYRRVVMYMNHNRLLQNRWASILTARNYRQMYRRMRYASSYSKFIRAQAEVIRRKEVALQQKHTELATAKKDKDILLGDARQQHTVLEGQKKERQVVIDNLNKKQKQLQSSIAQQRRKQANIDASIDRLIKQEIAAAEARRKKAEAQRRAAEERRRKQEAAERKRQEEARRQANNKNTKTSKGKGTKDVAKTETKPEPRTATPRYEDNSEADRTVSSGFRANRGRLPVPITGSYAITSRYGQYNVEGLSGVTLDSKGINLTGHRGAQARCVYNGEVTAVANIGGSYIVIVRHGGYYSVYSNLSSVSVRNGQSVTTRQTLGTVAADASGNATLHFQLRERQGNSAAHINPLPWLAR